MRPQYKFIVQHFWGLPDIEILNRQIEKESNKLLTVYEDVDIQSVVKTNDLYATVFYKVKLEKIDKLVDEDWV